MSDKHKSESISRRDFVVLSGGVASAMAFPAILTSRKALADPTELNLLAWYGHGEPDVVSEFEATHNVKFKPKYYAGGDNMLALIAQSPPGTYDIILSDSEFVQQLNEAGFIENLNPEDYPFDDFIHDDFRNFPGHWRDGNLYSVMVRFGHLGVAYNRNTISEEEASSYRCFWNSKLTGKVGHFDWHLPTLGMMSLYNGNSQSPFDLDGAAWDEVKKTTMSLRPQVGGFFDYGGTFNSLKNGEMLAMCGIGDWITGVLEKDGAPVTSVVPEEGGIQWTESYCIGKDSKRADIANRFIQYMLSPYGQVRSAEMAAYPAFCVTKAGQAELRKVNMAEAERTGQVPGAANNPVTLIEEGRIHYRDIPRQQSLEDWNDFWSEYKNA
ncbi:MAG: spermidine/putrescine ABC transporter substrate-binding protein [Gammaproteobacteria bacterium]|nr:spermidine/putrescine ABC transporter substrate-binding protein [Gammaproteobacteria bacterium]MXY65630.1 spermidine/putrescine ABC transporter substrate-binding protein [Gammaproteobacteria bacterium]MYG66830.1 spermidine/putrescine ABC transporter substrate-binding protein [Gammaproteobacteria bacterium]